MDMDPNVSMILTALLILIGGVVVAGFFYWRRQLDDGRLAKYVDWLVGAAEQQWAHLPGPQRRDWVIARLKERFPWFDEDLAKILIESAVLRVNQMKQPKQPADAPSQTVEWRGRRN